jgi:hypothetical protein
MNSYCFTIIYKYKSEIQYLLFAFQNQLKSNVDGLKPFKIQLVEFQTLSLYLALCSKKKALRFFEI